MQTATTATTATLDDELLTDREAARALNVGGSSFVGLQKEPDFPKPIWLGPRLKRHSKAALLAWAKSRTKRPAEWQAMQTNAAQLSVAVRRAKARAAKSEATL